MIDNVRQGVGYMKLEQTLIESIKTAIKNAFAIDVVDDLVMIEIPRDPSWGDYSTNAAMRLTKILRQNPRVIADSLAAELEKILKDADTITVANP